MTADDVRTMLDHTDKISVPGEVFKHGANEYWTLICLWQGMEFLNHEAAVCEQAAKQPPMPDGWPGSGEVHFTMIGSLPGLPVPKALLTCAFHWYAVSACNYVWTVGAIACRQGFEEKPWDYVKRIIPEVKVFRDKVAAHPAGMTKNRHDNDAERLASILPQLTFEDGSFYSGNLTVGLSDGAGKSSTSDAIKGWSICKVHAELRKRYWPPQE